MRPIQFTFIYIYDKNNKDLHFTVWYCVIYLWSCSLCPLPPLSCSTSVTRVTQPAPHHPTWLQPSGATKHPRRTTVPDCGLYFSGDGAHPAGFYRHVFMEESSAEQHAQWVSRQAELCAPVAACPVRFYIMILKEIHYKVVCTPKLHCSLLQNEPQTQMLPHF